MNHALTMLVLGGLSAAASLGLALACRVLAFRVGAVCQLSVRP